MVSWQKPFETVPPQVGVSLRRRIRSYKTFFGAAPLAPEKNSKSFRVSSYRHELQSKPQVSLLMTPIIIPCIIPHITPL